MVAKLARASGRGLRVGSLARSATWSSSAYLACVLWGFEVRSGMESVERSQLPRLSPDSYVGHCSVHWTHTIDHRRTGWLTPAFHSRFREILLHGLSYARCACPVYCLMPDHMHLLVSGLETSSNQRVLSKRLRADLGIVLGDFRLQKQAYDHVLRANEVERDAFCKIARYVLDNPYRAGICDETNRYPYQGALVPGYYGLDPRESGFWDRYWRIHNRIVEKPSKG